MNSYSETDIVATVCMAASADVANLTNDRIKALTGGHGMVNMAIHTAANVIAEDIVRGQDTSISNADTPRLPISDMIEKAIAAAKKAGADGANAALIVATLLYYAGSESQVGIPAGNRKLGATCRMIAGVDRSGVAAVPTPKHNSKISGFPAVQAIYEAMQSGKLTDIDGANVPANVAGGPIYGHSSLGEDIIWPQMAENGARIGTEAMIKAMRGASMQPDLFTCAVLGAAAILEIIHPDAEVPEKEADYGTITSVYLVGRSAVRTAGLPEKLTMKVTGQSYDTAELVGDLGLIIKDIGGPSVIGMIAFSEINSVFNEMIAGFSGTPVNAPIGHIGGYANIAMKMLIENGGLQEEVAEKIRIEKSATTVDEESALTSINIISHKSNEIHPGPVTQTLIKATEAYRNNAIMERAKYSYKKYNEGVSLEEVIKSLEETRIKKVTDNAGKLYSYMTGQEIHVELLDLYKGARRDNKLAQKYLSFDGSCDIKITINGEEQIMEDFATKVVPEIAKGNRPELLELYGPIAGLVLDELLLGSVYTADFVVPLAVYSVMDDANEEETKRMANKANEIAIISGGIPGSPMRARNIARLSRKMMKLREK